MFGSSDLQGLGRALGCLAFVAILLLIVVVFAIGRCSAKAGVTLQSPIKVESKGAADGK